MFCISSSMRPARTYDMLAAGTRTASSLAPVQQNYCSATGQLGSKYTR